MSKASKQKAGAASSDVVDITHEEVNHENGVSYNPKIITPEEQIKLEIAKFNIADAAIEQMKKTYGDLTVKGPEDKDGYKKVREAWSEVRTARTKLEKKGLELRKNYNEISKAIGKEEDRLIELLTPLEEDLYKKWKDIDEEKERAKKEKEAEEERLLMAKVEELLNLGMSLNGGFYTIGDTISVDVATLRSMPDDQYSKLKTAVAAKNDEIIAARKAEEERQRKDREDFERQQNELKQQQEELRLERERMEKQRRELEEQRQEAETRRLTLRHAQLKSIGMSVVGNYMGYDNKFNSYHVPLEDISNCPEHQWSEFLQDIKETIADRDRKREEHFKKVKAEQEAREIKEKQIAASMQEAGLNYDYSTKSFRFKNEVEDISIAFEALLPFADEEIKQKATEFLTRISAAKAEAQRLEIARQAEADRAQKAGMKDQEILSMTIGDLKKTVSLISLQDYKTKKWQERAKLLKDKLLNLLKEFES